MGKISHIVSEKRVREIYNFAKTQNQIFQRTLFSFYLANKSLGSFIYPEIFSMDVSAIDSMSENMVWNKMQIYI